MGKIWRNRDDEFKKNRYSETLPLGGSNFRAKIA